jgi:hypothetical protein
MKYNLHLRYILQYLHLTKKQTTPANPKTHALQIIQKQEN